MLRQKGRGYLLMAMPALEALLVLPCGAVGICITVVIILKSLFQILAHETIRYQFSGVGGLAATLRAVCT